MSNKRSVDFANVVDAALQQRGIEIADVTVGVSVAVFAHAVRASADGTLPSLLLAALAAADPAYLRVLLTNGVPVGGLLFHLRHMELLLECGADPNEVDGEWRTPLHVACEKMDITAIVLLLEAGADVNKIDASRRSPLHYMLTTDTITTTDMVRVLLNAGADPRAVDKSGESALTKALRLHHCGAACALWLVRGMIHVPESLYTLHTLFKTVAASTSFHAVEIFKFLVDAPADVNGVDEAGDTPLHSVVVSAYCDTFADILLAAGARLDNVNADGETPVMAALSRNCVTAPLLRVFLRHGAPADSRSALNGRTLCHAAAASRDHESMATLIRTFGVDINAVATDDGATPLIVATQHCALQVVSLLVAAGAKLDVARKVDGATALHVAIQLGCVDVANALIVGGADVNLRDALGWTAFHCAVALGNEQLVDRLIAAGADVDCLSSSGESPVHLAATTRRDVAMLQRLVDAGANLNFANRKLQTACHVAARSGNSRALRVLVAAGAALDEKDGEGRTPLETVFDHRGDKACIQILVAAGARLPHVRKPETILHRFLSFSKHVPIVRALVARGVDVNARDSDKLVASSMAMNDRKLLVALFAIGADLSRSVKDSWDHFDGPSAILVRAAVGIADRDAPAKLAAARVELVRARGAEVCIALQSLELDALQLSEIIRHASGRAGAQVPFHELWRIATTVKHFRERQR